MNQEKEIVKIITHNGRVITLTISKKSPASLYGTDKFGNSTIVSIDDIKSMYPISKLRGKNAQ